MTCIDRVDFLKLIITDMFCQQFVLPILPTHVQYINMKTNNIEYPLRCFFCSCNKYNFHQNHRYNLQLNYGLFTS